MSAHVAAVVKACFAALSAGASVLPCRKLCPPWAHGRETYVATLPCETLMSAKQAIKDKLQGSVATHLRSGAVVNNLIKTGLSLSLRVKKN